MDDANTKKLTRLLGDYVAGRLYLNDRSREKNEDGETFLYKGIKFTLCFKEREFSIRVYSTEHDLKDLSEFLKGEVETRNIFSKSGLLKSRASKRSFPKYSERLEYKGFEEDFGEHINEILITYRVTDNLLRLNRESLEETVYDYAISPLLAWTLQKK